MTPLSFNHSFTSLLHEIYLIYQILGGNTIPGLLHLHAELVIGVLLTTRLI
jgi:hypothetical protein